MTLFDFASDEDKKQYEISYPNVEELDKNTMLAYEKEVLGIYVSGHPLDEYETMWRRNVSATTLDFEIDEEVGKAKVEDGSSHVIGGIISAKSVKTTRTNSMMAFITVEDLVGTVEVIVFPRDYEKYKEELLEDNKVFIRGKVNAEEDKPAKLICAEIIPFDKVPRKLYIRFSDIAEFESKQTELIETIANSDGNDVVIIVCSKENVMKQLGVGKNVNANEELINALENKFGEKNVALVEGSLSSVNNKTLSKRM
jgi:DNA polymerase-3 subunit alpha